MSDKVIITNLQENQINEIVAAFKAIGWNKPRSIYEQYLSEQAKGERQVFIATLNNKFCGYVTIKWTSNYPPFYNSKIPEIVDLNVLPEFRNKGIGSALIKRCENAALTENYSTIGIGVGLIADYGNAQRLYVQLGYIPDGKGLHYKNNPVNYNETVVADDDLVIYFTKKI